MRAFRLRNVVACWICVAALGFGGGPVEAQWFGFHALRCQTDDEVEKADRSPYEDAALHFVQRVVSPNPTEVYANAASALKTKITQDEFMAFVRTRIRPLGGIDNWRVDHSYYVTGVSVGSDSKIPIVCTTVAHGGSSTPEGRILLAPGSASEQAQVIVAGDALSATWAFVTRLVLEDKDWRVESFRATPIAVVGKSAFDLWLLAREQHRSQNDFNAFVLYATALQLSSRGPTLQIGIQPEINKELDALKRPSELDTQLPYHWRFDGAEAPIVKVGPVGVDGKMYLMITQELTQWVDNREAEQRNRALIPIFSRAHPEYADAFGGLVIEAVERGGGRALRTLAGAMDVPQ